MTFSNFDPSFLGFFSRFSPILTGGGGRVKKGPKISKTISGYNFLARAKRFIVKVYGVIIYQKCPDVTSTFVLKKSYGDFKNRVFLYVYYEFAVLSQIKEISARGSFLAKIQYAILRPFRGR